MTTQDLTNLIINSMIPYLNPNQITLLSATLTKELYDYDLVKKVTVLSNYEDNNMNDVFLTKFAVEKRVQGMSEKTIYQYVKTTKNFLDKVQKDFKLVIKDDITYYFAILIHNKKMSDVSLDNTRRFITPFFNWCFDNDYIQKNPFRGIKRIKSKKKIKEILTDNDIVLLKDNCITRREIALVDFLLSTGVRVSELKQLKVKDIDINNNEAIIYGEKTKTYRKVYLDAECSKHMIDYLETRTYDSEYVFCSSRKSHGSVCTQTIEKELRDIADRAHINKHCTVHLFRRTLATRLYRKGMDMKYIANLLGHSVRILEECYLILNDDDIKSNYSKYSII